MKIIKLDKRFRAKRYQGHTTAIVYNRWCMEAQRVEDYLRNNYDSRGGYASTFSKAKWWGYFEKRKCPVNERKYYITFEDESLVSAMMLADVLKDNMEDPPGYWGG